MLNFFHYVSINFTIFWESSCWIHSNGKVIGLSKIPRIIDMYARRLQVQERLTHQIESALNNILEPKGEADTYADEGCRKAE